MKNHFHVAYVKSRLRYESETGDLFWTNFEGGNPSWISRYVGKKAGSITKHGYLYVFLGRKNIFAHRLAWALHYGVWPDDEIDHINGVKTDNRISNLRSVSRFLNQRNKTVSPRNKSGCPGVFLKGERWVAQIGARSTRRHLGSFSTKGEAVNARIAAQMLMGYHENHGRAPQEP